MDDGPRFDYVEGGKIYDIYAPDDDYPDPEKEYGKIFKTQDGTGDDPYYNHNWEGMQESVVGRCALD